MESLLDNVLLEILITHHWHEFTISKTNTRLWLQYISLHSPHLFEIASLVCSVCLPFVLKKQ